MVHQDGDKVAQDLLADQHAALDLADRGRRDVEVQQEVARLAEVLDVVGHAALAPRRDLGERAAGIDDGARDLLDRGLELVVLQVGTEQEHELVSAHRPISSSLRACDPVGRRRRWRQKGARYDMKQASSGWRRPASIARLGPPWQRGSAGTILTYLARRNGPHARQPDTDLRTDG